MTTAHPITVHFPIVLVLLWPVVDAAGLLLGRPDLSRAGLALAVLASLACLAASVTGESAYNEAYTAGFDPKLLATHTDPANLFPWAMFAVLFARAFGPLKLGRRGHLAGVVLGFGLWPFILSVGGSGGELVYEHGVGVKARIDRGDPPR